MYRLILRHGASQEITGGSGDPALTDEACIEARRLGKNLGKAGYDLSAAAVSEAFRTTQTAVALRVPFDSIKPYASLNEVETDIPEDELTAMLSEGKAPDEAIEAGERVVSNPPVESLWVSHGLLIAGIDAVVRMRNGVSLRGYNLLLDNLGYRELNIK